MKYALRDALSHLKGSIEGTQVFWLTIIVLGVGLLSLTVDANDVQRSYAQGPMPSMTPMMTMTHMATGTHEPMPSMTPMMTMTPQPTAPPNGDDNVAPEGTILVNDGADSITNPLVTLTLSAEDEPGGTGVAWMYIREWGWDHDHGWHDMHRDGRHGEHHGGMDCLHPARLHPGAP